MVVASKVPILKPIIENGNKPPITQVVKGVETIIAPATAEEKPQRRLKLKAKSTLLMGIPNEHHLKFNSIKDAKSLLKAVEKRFRGNAATKKTQMNLLKQQFENFTASSSEDLQQFILMTLKDEFEVVDGYVNNESKKILEEHWKEVYYEWECKAPRNQEKNNRESTRKNVHVERPASSTLVSCDGLGGYDWSDQAEDGLTNFALMAYSSTISNSEIIDKCKTGLGYNAIPPPYTGNFLPPKPYFSSLEEFVNKPIVNEPIVMKPVVETSEAKDSKDKPEVVRNNCGPLLIEEWISNSEDKAGLRPKIEKKTVKPSFAKIEFLKSKEQVKSSRKVAVKQGNMSYLKNYKEINRGYVAFRGNPNGGKITGKGTIRTGKLDFENVYFVKELKFNKKNIVLFTDTECIVLSPNFKLTDESHVLLKVPRKNNMYSVDSKNIVPKGGLTCLFAKATSDESKLWHRRLGHLNFKTMNKLAERRNRTLIEAVRTMLADSKLPTTFWAEAVNTVCYVQNRVLVVKPHNKTLYELFHGRTPALSFMRPFWCPATILNTKDHLGKFNGQADEGFFVRYSINSKAFRVFNSRTRIVEENMHVKFSENTPNIAGKSKSYQDDRFQPSSNDGKKVDEETRQENKCKDQEEQDNVNSTDIVNVAATNEMDVKSAFLYGKIKEEVYVCQPPRFEDHDFPDKVYKVEKASYGVHQAPKAWRTYLLPRIAKVKNASTPMETQKPLLKDEDREEVDVHMYRSMISSLMYLTSSMADTMFTVCACARYQVDPKVDGKKVVISEASIKRDLQFGDEEGVDCLPNEPRKTKRKDTQVPQLSVLTESIANKAVNEEMDDKLVRVSTTASSLEAKQDSGNIAKTQSKATPNESSSQGTDSGGGPKRQDTIRDTVAQTRSERVSKVSNDPLVVGVNTPRSGEDSLEINELMELCINLQNMVLNLETTKTTQAIEIYFRVLNMYNLTDIKKQRLRTHKLKRLYKVGLSAKVRSSKDEGLDGDEVIVEDAEMLFDVADDLRGEEAKINADYELAQRLQAKEQDESTDVEKEKLFMEFLEKRRKFFTAKRAKEKRNRPPTRAQQRTIITELLEESSNKAEAEITQEGSSKRAGDELEQKRSKKQKVEDDKESKERKKCLEIIPNDGDDVTIDATPLSSKSLTIVDYKIYKEGKKNYFQIFRSDGNSQMDLTFSKMLKIFNREDLEVHWRLVKDRFKKVKPVDNMDSFLLRNLKTIFKHHVEENNILYYLLVEKMYPLTNHTLHQMFNNVKLQVDYECEMAFELLRLVKKHLKEGYVSK
nr:ribonuclease H-like domain-containing protein [Tanacetum cinerariifolium]